MWPVMSDDQDVYALVTEDNKIVVWAQNTYSAHLNHERSGYAVATLSYGVFMEIMRTRRQ